MFMHRLGTPFAPKRQRQRKITVYGQDAKDEINMEYTRMIMTATKSNFLDSVFVTEFFGKHFNYMPPCRSVVMGTLLDQLFEDTQKKVKDSINFKDADTFVYSTSCEPRTSPTCLAPFKASP